MASFVSVCDILMASGSCLGVACAGSGLEDLSAPVQQQFEELRVTNPRLYFSHTQLLQQPQPASQQSQQSQPQDAGWKQPGGAQQPQPQQQPQDVVAILRSIDCNALSDRPMEPAVANKVRLSYCVSYCLFESARQ
jgi:hypothetical protein